MTTLLITGANRGIGLELVRQYAAEGATIFAAARAPDDAPALTALAEAHAAITPVTLDVADPASVAKARDTIGDTPIDILINNAGVGGRGAATFGALDDDAFRETLEVNAIGPARVSDVFLDNVRASDEKKIVMISSDLGGISAASGGFYAYRASKAALNMLTKAMGEDLRGQGVMTLALHPGWVQTDMGGPSAPVPAAKSVAGMRRLIADLNLEMSGAYSRYDGERLAW